MNRKREVKKCVYCTQLADTKDHIPSKNLFATGMGPKNPIIVPSCVGCNHRFSHDEEYFRYYVCALAEEYSLHVYQVPSFFIFMPTRVFAGKDIDPANVG